MKIMTYSVLRANHAATLDAVLDDCEEIVIMRAGKDPVVIVSLDDYQSLKETASLLRTPESAQWQTEGHAILKRMNSPVRELRRSGNESIGKPGAMMGTTDGGPAYTSAGAKSSRAGSCASTERHAAARISTARCVSSRG